MRRYALDFLRRGLTAAGFGPIILAILYLILRSASDLEVLSVGQVGVGLFLPFLALMYGILLGAVLLFIRLLKRQGRFGG